MVPGNVTINMTKRLLSEFERGDTSNRPHLFSDLASDIQNNKSNFVELVENLDYFLTNSDTHKQNLGLEVLINVLNLLPKSFLSERELSFVVQFFSSKIKQHHSFTPIVLEGFSVLVENSEISQGSLHVITSTLFSNVVWQTQSMADRRNLYSILQYITFNCLEAYRTVSSEFLFNVISSVDGERDPRNLLLLFSFLPHLYRSIPLGPLAEDAFEVVSCYFPIDFHSASEAGSVTREDLVKALIPCLLAVPEFSEFCITLIQEKLDSTLKSAKIDSYELLVEGCGVWPVQSVEPHCESLWLSVKQDILPPRDTQTAGAAVLALQALIRTMSPANLPSLIDWITRSCEGFLSDVQLSLFEPSSQLLLSVMAASPSACSLVSNKLLPGLVSLLQVTPENSKVLVMNKVITFIKTFLRNSPTSNCLIDVAEIVSEREVVESRERSHFKGLGTIIHFSKLCTQKLIRDKIIPILKQHSNQGEDHSWSQLHKELVLSCSLGPVELQQAAYLAVTAASGGLAPDCRALLYSHVTSVLVNQPPSPLRSACIKCLQALSLTNGLEIERNVFKYLTIDQGTEEDLALVKNKFGAICSLALTDRFHPALEQQFMALMCKGPIFKTAALTCLSELIEDEEVQANTLLIHFMFNQSSVLPTLVNLNISGSDLLNSARIIQNLVRLQNARDQKRVIQPLVEQVLQNSDCTQKMVLLEALLGPLWPEVTVLSAADVSFVLFPTAIQAECPLAHTSALQLLASLINKASDDVLLELVSQHLKNYPIKQTAFAHSYITKALVLRDHPVMEHWLNKLVDLLDDKDVSDVAAEGVQLIVEGSPTFLNRQNHCCIRLLYRQRLFNLLVPRLINASHQEQHLKALIYLLQSVPHSVYIPQIKPILPLLLKSLDGESERLLLTVLHTLESLVSNNHSCLDQHLDASVPRFLHLATHFPLMKVRIAALRCLSSSLKCSSINLLPHKQKVLLGLVPCLDDRKRLVRKEAARTRSKWFLLGAPTADP